LFIFIDALYRIRSYLNIYELNIEKDGCVATVFSV